MLPLMEGFTKVSSHEEDPIHIVVLLMDVRSGLDFR